MNTTSEISVVCFSLNSFYSFISVFTDVKIAVVLS